MREQLRGLWQAAAQVATPQLRNMGTLGGNLCLDTRCNYYDQNYEWRKAIDFCMKKDGEICWVATASKRCLAVSSTDTRAGADRARREGEARVASTASASSRSPSSTATTASTTSRAAATRSSPRCSCPTPRVEEPYWKLRRRGSFDFPVLGVAAAREVAPTARSRRRASCSAPSPRSRFSRKAGEFLVGKRLTDDVIAEAGRIVASRAKPMDNTDFDVYWRKQVVAEFVGYALARAARRRHERVRRMRIARRTS